MKNTFILLIVLAMFCIAAGDAPNPCEPLRKRVAELEAENATLKRQAVAMAAENAALKKQVAELEAKLNPPKPEPAQYKSIRDMLRTLDTKDWPRGEMNETQRGIISRQVSDALVESTVSDRGILMSDPRHTQGKYYATLAVMRWAVTGRPLEIIVDIQTSDESLGMLKKGSAYSFDHRVESFKIHGSAAIIQLTDKPEPKPE